MTDRSIDNKVYDKIDSLVSKGYSKDKIYHILSEEYTDKSTLKGIIANCETIETKVFRKSKQKKMIAIAISVILFKIFWNIIGGHGVSNEINLTTLFVFWGLYDSVKKSKYETLAISVWVFVSVEVLNFRYKPDDEIYFLLILIAIAVTMTVLGFRWQQEQKRVSTNITLKTKENKGSAL